MAINLKDAKNGDKFQTVTGHTVVYHQDENKLEYIPYKYCMVYEPSGKRYYYSNEGTYYKGKDANLNLIEGTIEPMIKINPKPVETPKEESIEQPIEQPTEQPVEIPAEKEEPSIEDTTEVIPEPAVGNEPKFLESSNNFVAEKLVNGIATFILVIGIIVGIIGVCGCLYKTINASLIDGTVFLIPYLVSFLSCLLLWAFIKLIVNISFRLTSIDNNLQTKDLSIETNDKKTEKAENPTSVAKGAAFLDSSNKFVAEKAINVVATIILVIGIGAGVVGLFGTLYYAAVVGSYAAISFFVQCLVCLLSCLLYWALIRLIINISYRLTKIDNKIRKDMQQ